MVEKIEAFKAQDGKLFLSEENAVRHEAVEGLCRIIPEFQMVRPRLESNLDAVAAVMGPMLAFRARVPSKRVFGDDVAAIITSERQTDGSHAIVGWQEREDVGCDCAALMAGNDGKHHPTCSSLAPGR